MRFVTNSERIVVIDAFRKGEEMPTKLKEHKMLGGLMAMTHEDECIRWDCSEVRKWLEGLQKAQI